MEVDANTLFLETLDENFKNIYETWPFFETISVPKKKRIILIGRVYGKKHFLRKKLMRDNSCLLYYRKGVFIIFTKDFDKIELVYNKLSRILGGRRAERGNDTKEEK